MRPVFAYADEVPPPIVRQIENPLYTSCVRWVHYLEPKAPLVDANLYIGLPRSPITVGSIAVFHYQSSDEWHVAVVTSLEDTCFEVDEANFKHGQHTNRCVDYNDKNLIMFWNPN